MQKKTAGQGRLADKKGRSRERKDADSQSLESQSSGQTKFQELAENVPVGITLIDAKGQYRYLNNKFKEMFGYDNVDIPNGAAWFEKAYPDKNYRKRVIETWIDDFSLYRPGEKKPWIFDVMCKDGTTKTVRFMPVQLDSGEILVAYEDFTQLLNAQKALEESEGKLRLLYEKSIDPIFIFDGTRFLDCNEAALRIMGCGTKEELLQYHPLDISPEYQPDGQLSRRKGAQIISKVKKEGSGYFEWLHKKNDGKEFWVDISLTTISYKGENPLMYVVWRDITERKRTEIKLKNSEERYMNMFENIPFPTFVYDFDTLNIVDVNSYAVRYYGYTREELLGMTLKDLKPDDDVPMLLAHLAKTDPSQEKGHWRHRKKDGTIIDVEITAHALQFPGKNYRIFLANDVTEIKKAETALRFTQFAVDNAAVGIIWVDEKGNILYGNDEVCRILGYSRDELTMKNISQIDIMYGKEDFAKNWHDIKKAGSESMESVALTGHGKALPIELAINYMEYGQKGYICAIVKDITKRKTTEEELKKSEKELKVKSNRLEEANTALKVLLHHREDDRKDFEEKLISNIKQLVLPYIEKMKKQRTGGEQSAFIEIIETNLNDILSPFLQKMSLKYSNFTPTEIQVANLIKVGKTSKEIAEIMRVSTGTIDTHRNNIRGKLALNKKKVNLRTYLLSL